MPARHRAVQPRRRRPVLLAGLVLPVLVLPVLVLAGLYLVHIASAGGRPPGAADGPAGPARSCATAAAAGPAGCAQTPTAQPSSRPARRDGAGSRPPRRSASPRGSTAPSRHTASPAASPSPSASPARAGESAAQQVLALINQARAKAGLPAYIVTAGLDRSSAAHNQRMADGCGLSHQCQGEPSLGARETAAGVDWTAAGENIGEGGPEPDTAAAIARMALTLTGDMLNEKPPDDGHRLNILSSTFSHIGITVQEDSSGTVWMTQDFSN